jgi:7-cyano-7-deazaguanine synthase in queuosine biosynthesis
VACGEEKKCQERKDGWEDYGVFTIKSIPATTAVGSRNGGALKCGA